MTSLRKLNGEAISLATTHEKTHRRGRDLRTCHQPDPCRVTPREASSPGQYPPLSSAWLVSPRRSTAGLTTKKWTFCKVSLATHLVHFVYLKSKNEGYEDLAPLVRIWAIDQLLVNRDGFASIQYYLCDYLHKVWNPDCAIWENLNSLKWIMIRPPWLSEQKKRQLVYMCLDKKKEIT